MRRLVPILFALVLAASAGQDKRLIPPPGIEVPAAERAALERGARALGRAIDELRPLLQDRTKLRELLPDVEIFHKAVQGALTYDEFFRKRELDRAKDLLKRGLQRAKQLRAGKTPWTKATGSVLRGYRSRIDDSVQPYGLVVPGSWKPGAARRHRLDIWLHGRNNSLSELRFLDDRLRRPSPFEPEDSFVLHPYGRFCNAFKFAGEVDVFEALDHVRKHYSIDDDRVVMRGFSMGGAGCWHLAVHYAGRWAASSPGAGFAETAVYQNIFKDKVPPTAIEQTLWRLYDATDYAVNLSNCPTVAYSGEIDRQKQAADIMAAAMEKEGLELVHLIGPKTGHKYHPETKKAVARRVDALAAKGRNPVPKKIRFTTFTLRYNRMKWVTVDSLEEHWKRARVDAEIAGETLRVKTANVAAVTFSIPAGRVPFTTRPSVILDGTELAGPAPAEGRAWTASFRKSLGRWTAAGSLADAGLRKRHGLQGPIDDAFMDRFVIVTPTREPMNETVGAWVAREQARAIEHWRRFFRGNPRMITDRELSPEEASKTHLILWGDPSSNRVLERVEKLLPIHWNKESIRVGSATYSSEKHVPVLIFPNPLNPKRYVVLNSGYTFQENSHKSNSRHIPLLPDWAVLDMTAPAGSTMSQRAVKAGFFGERWELK